MSNRDFLEYQIEQLEKKLAEYYKIQEDSERPAEIDLREEISKLEFMESAYSFIERGVVKEEGGIYEKYKNYLNNVRRDLQKYRKLKEEIEEKESLEITNLKLILDHFRSLKNITLD